MSISCYQRRRRDLMARLPHGSLAVVSGNVPMIRNGDVTYPFYQNSHFLYLTGLTDAADAILTVAKNDAGQISSTLWAMPLTDHARLWEGQRHGWEDYQRCAQVDRVLDRQKWETEGMAQCKTAQHIYALPNQSIVKVSHQQSLMPHLSALRLIKTSEELDALRQAADMSVQAHLAVMKAAPTASSERALMGTWLAACANAGELTQAYPPIIAGGGNACILHYTHNDQPLSSSDLLLIDAGVSHQGYAADITRTYPVSGRFSEQQKALYEVVLAAQNAGIEQIKPGQPYANIQRAVVKSLAQGLKSLGLLSGSLEAIIETKSYRDFYMHGSGHWLGLDVHDVGDYEEEGQSVLLKPGMVLTIEPGLYCGADNQQTPAAWRGLGVRIEDDIVVTDQGHDNLTAALPKTIADIEHIMGG